RYAYYESARSYHKMKNESLNNLLLIAKDFGINPQITFSGIIHLHFTDYIRLACNIKEKKWKLVNRKLENGYVEVTKQEFARLLQEAIRERIQSKLPLEIPKDISFVLREYIAEVKQVLNKEEKEKIKISCKSDASLKTDNFPPCLKNILDNLTKGVNLAHSARFALTSFLLNIGMEVDKIINLFNTSPDFKEDKTRYQVQHISSGKYIPPSCATMATYSQCIGKDELCKRINHPLSYYKLKYEKNSKGENR
ncbi:MAG: DNA primase regulatory subunit PriL, partial [Methanosarcinales archaeon]